MRHLNLVLLFTFFSLSVMQAQKTAVISKVTATWCPNCGTWGWSLAEELKSTYATNDPEGLFLGVHFSGNLQNPTAIWFTNNLNATGQPQFFVNNERTNVNSSNAATRVEDMKTQVSQYFNDNSSNAKMSFATNRVIDWDGNFNLEIDIEAMEESMNEHYLAVYVYENNVPDSQSGITGQVMHPNVLREVVSANPYGDIYLTPGQGGRGAEKVSLTWESNPEYVNDNLGFLAIMWEKVGDDYIMDYTISQDNWTAQLSVFLAPSDQDFISCAE